MSIARIHSRKEQAMASAHVWRDQIEPMLATAPPNAKAGQMMVTLPVQEWSLLVLAIDDAWREYNTGSEPRDG